MPIPAALTLYHAVDDVHVAQHTNTAGACGHPLCAFIARHTDSLDAVHPRRFGEDLPSGLKLEHVEVAVESHHAEQGHTGADMHCIDAVCSNLEEIRWVMWASSLTGDQDDDAA